MLALVPSQKPQRHVLALWAHRTTLNDLMQNGQSLSDAHSSFQLVFCQHVASSKRIRSFKSIFLTLSEADEDSDSSCAGLRLRRAE